MLLTASAKGWECYTATLPPATRPCLIVEIAVITLNDLYASCLFRHIVNLYINRISFGKMVMFSNQINFIDHVLCLLL